jgi:hypothetical protein
MSSSRRLEVFKASQFVEDLKSVSWKRAIAMGAIVGAGSIFTPFNAPEQKPKNPAPQEQTRHIGSTAIKAVQPK